MQLSESKSLHMKSKHACENKQRKMRIEAPSTTPSDCAAIAQKVCEKRKQGRKKKSWAQTDKDICSSFWEHPLLSVQSFGISSIHWLQRQKMRGQSICFGGCSS